jgi:hypothetical protein
MAKWLFFLFFIVNAAAALQFWKYGRIEAFPKLQFWESNLKPCGFARLKA